MLFHVPPMARHRIITVAQRRNRPRLRRIALSTRHDLQVARMETPRHDLQVAQTEMLASASPRELHLVQVAHLVQAVAVLAALTAVAQVVVGAEAADAAMASVVVARR